MKKGLLARVKNSEFEGNNYVGNLSHVHASKIGKMTYIGSKCSILYARIGRFCSIAGDVKIVVGSHPTNTWISTHPSSYSSNCCCGVSFTDRKLYAEYKYVDEENKYMVDIGNDVWIGTGAMIMGGVKIGDGAIILAGAVVTIDVPPYTIVGGVPAKSIGTRFEEKEIELLVKSEWWNRDYEWLRKNASSFSDITAFKAALSEHEEFDS